MSTKTNPFDLEGIVGSLEPVEQGVVAIDFSDIFGHPAETVVWHFREPSLPELFSVEETAKQVSAQFEEWPESLTSLVALMSLSYIKPPKSKQHSYLLVANLAHRMGTRFVKVSARWKQHFPHLDDLKPAVETEKNDDGTEGDDADSVPEVPASDAE